MVRIAFGFYGYLYIAHSFLLLIVSRIRGETLELGGGRQGVLVLELVSQTNHGNIMK